MNRSLLTVLMATILLAGCAADPGPPFDSSFGVLRIMNSVMDPAADAYWDSVGWIITAEGTDFIHPQSEEEWAAVRNAAIVVIESSNLLMMGERAVDQEGWIEFCLEMIAAGKIALAAAEAEDTDEVFKVGGYIYDACTNCHSQYVQESSDETLPARSVPAPEASE